MNRGKSARLFEKARRLLPGGVNSPVRAFKAVGGSPLFIQKAKGSKIWDVDGNQYIDYVCSWGPLILGHAHPRVLEAIRKTAARGTSFGASTELELKLAELITRAMPSVEMVRMVSSGTEATMSALRLARAFTGRSKVIKFEGCYHGHGDSFLIKAGSGATTLGVPDSPGVTSSIASDTLNARYNDLESVKRLIARHCDTIAAVIVEPIAGNMGLVLPEKEFLRGLSNLCSKNRILLIFDEVITGFRVAYGGAQKLHGIKPDLTTLGKIVGGGLPAGAYGGRREIMEMVAPSGPVYQAGTLSGNPLAMAAGYETLRILSERKSCYSDLDRRGKTLARAIEEIIQNHSLPLRLNSIGSMFTLFFTEKQVTDYDSAKSSNTSLFAAYFREMLDQGIYLPPSQFETAFLSMAHSDRDIEKTIAAIRSALKKIFPKNFLRTYTS
ncbi:MAG: glutamate-1-semialdehyde 2,1-aminomutase [Bacteroidota bacterium]